MSPDSHRLSEFPLPEAMGLDLYTASKIKIHKCSSGTCILIPSRHDLCLLLSFSSFSHDVALSLIFDLHWLLHVLCFITTQQTTQQQ